MFGTSPILDTYEQLPHTFVRGEGVWLYDDKGEKYLDLYGGHAVALLGHCPPTVVDAISKQAKEFFFYSNVVPIPIREEGAKALAKLCYAGFENIFFCNSGAEANENALSLSIKLTGRSKLIAYKGSFHGRSHLATCVTDSPAFHKALGNWCGDRVTFLEPNNISQIEEAITADVAAVILEPIQSIGGVTEFTSGYLKILREQCTKVGAKLIFDEVQTGMGRIGLPFFSGHSGISPDIFTTAKGIACGYPVGAMFVSDEIASHIKIGDLGSTYGAGPVAMAAVKATAETIINDHLIENVEKINALFQSFIELPFVEEVRGRGCLIGFRTPKKAKELVTQLLAKKIITGTCKDPHVLRLLPPITLQEREILEFKKVLIECFN